MAVSDFGEACFVLSRNFSNQVLIIKGERIARTVYQFHKRNDRQYSCAACKFWRTRLVTVENGRIVGRKHPEDDHHPQCVPVPEHSIVARDVDGAMRCNVRTTGKRPREAYSEAVTSISKKFKTSSEQASVISQFPTFSEVRTQLYRQRSAARVPVPDPYNIPEEWHITMRGKSVMSGDENF